jgi:glucose-1-phosphate thymidylyltransferase
LADADKQTSGGTVFGYHVSDPERYGVVGFDKAGTAQTIIEKPENPASNYAVTGLYFLDANAPEMARQVQPSARGELEITSLLEMYLAQGNLRVKRMGRGYAWLDTGTHASLLDAGNFVRTLTQRQGLQTGCLEEIAHDQGWIDDSDLLKRAEMFEKNDYGSYLKTLLK